MTAKVYKKLNLLILLWIYTSSLEASPAASNMDAHSQLQCYSQETIAHLLNWRCSDDACNLCHGFYEQSPLVTGDPHPLPIRDQATHITAEGPSLFSQKGWSLIQTNVEVTQPGRHLRADKAYIFRDPNTQKITQLKLMGNVRMEEFGKLIHTSEVCWNLVNHTMQFNNVIYHVSEATIPELKFNSKLRYDAFGCAQAAHRQDLDILDLWNASYSTCSPLKPFWQLQAAHIHLDRPSGRGTARNVFIKIKKIPIFYSPYLSFPISSERKSGFLGITASSSNQNGFDLSVPYYWNMAPNYDMTITPRFMTKRGVQFNDLFRYLIRDDHGGSIYASFIPYDKEFNSFRQTTINGLPNPTPDLVPYVNALKKMSNSRGYFSMNDTAYFADNWNTYLSLNYVTDPYYFRDFGTHFSVVNANQLLNELNIQHSSEHWDFSGLVQSYQTLHLIDPSQRGAVNQYTRLPEFDFNGNYPDTFLGLDWALNGQAVNFIYDSDFPPFTYQMPIGQRLHLRPSVSRPFNWSFGYFTPLVALDNTDYNAQLATQLPRQRRPQFTDSRNLPIFNIDSGLYFDRYFHFCEQDYIQTLEPRVFYLYVPYQNQDQFPNFDTQYLPFSTENLFTLNRFAGYDRLENANQVSLALSSKILDPDLGQVLNATGGFIYYFDNPRVTLPNLTLPTDERFSPFVGQLTVTPCKNWTGTALATWNLNKNRVDLATLGLTYSRDTYHILNFGYNFVRNLNQTANTLRIPNTYLINVGLSWPLSEKWSTVGYWYYNVTQARPESYYGGLEYSTCCWALRFIISRNYMGPSAVPGVKTNTFRNTYYVQFMLKGLGNFGNSDPSDLLTATLPGFVDPFKS